MRAACATWLLVGCSTGVVHDRLNVRTDGAVLPVEVHGAIGSGTLLLVESGGPSGPSIAQRDVGYFPFEHTLEPQMAVALYDRRGTGNATGDYRPSDQSMGQLVADLRAVLSVLDERYAPARLVLMGHSFGTYSSALFQLEHPGEVDAWVAAAPAILEGPDDLYVPYRHTFACRVAAEQLEQGQQEPLWSEIEAFCAAHPTLPAEWETPEREQLWLYLEQIEDRLEPWPAMRPDGLLSAVFASHYNIFDAQLQGNRISEVIVAEPGREDLLPELGAISVPAAVITGEFDGTTPTELGSAVVEALGDPAALTEIAGAGHYPMADDPQGFAEAVLELVDGL
jgi:pimeloyl-ACP methyl ester carboxylesterase